MTRSYRGDTQKQTSRQSNVGVAQNSGRMESVAFFLFFLQQTLLASLLCKLAAKFYSYTLKSSPMILASLPKIRRFSQIKLLLMPRCPCRISPCVVYIFNIYIYRYEQKRRDFFFLFCFFAKTSRRVAWIAVAPNCFVGSAVLAFGFRCTQIGVATTPRHVSPPRPAAVLKSALISEIAKSWKDRPRSHSDDSKTPFWVPA